MVLPAHFRGKRFLSSFSGGKDSTLALHRALKAGMVPVGLLTTWNTDAGRTWFHGLPEPVLSSISAAWGIPLHLMKTGGAEYAENFERFLSEAAGQGVEVCVFGDIDLEAHRTWCTDRCRAAGLEACFPLWQEERRALVLEFLDTGYRTIITTVDTERLPDTFLGRELTRETIAGIEACGADACGEEGEYHTFVYSGPGWRSPVPYRFGTPIRQGQYAILPVLP